MIKKSFLKNILREVRGTLSRFIAIFAITALGAGVFAGLRATGPNMRATANLYYEQQHLMDYRLLSTMGFTESDIEALWRTQGAQAVMPTYSVDVLINAPDDGTSVARLHGLPQNTREDNENYLNRLVIEEGRMPLASSECVVDNTSIYKIGDVITVAAQNDEDSLDMLHNRRFTVVGRGSSPYYISFGRGNTNIGNGSIAYFAYVPSTAFDSEVYTEVYLTSNDTSGLTAFSKAYEQTVAKGEAGLEIFGQERAQIRYNEIYTEASQELADAEKELEEARAEAQQKLDDAWQEIQDAERELADARAKINKSAKELADARQQIQDAEAQIASGRATLGQKQAEYDEGLAQYNAQRAEYEKKLEEYNAGLAQYNQGLQQIEALYQALQALDDAGTALQAMLPGLPIIPNPADPAEQAFAQTAGVAIAGMQALAQQLAGAGMHAPALEQAANDASTALSAGQYATVAAYVSGASGGVRPGVDAAKAQIDTQAQPLQEAAQGLAIWKQKLDEAGATLAQGAEALAAGWAQVTGYENQLAEAKQEVEDGARKLADARAKLADGEKELADGKAEYEEQKQKAEKELADAQAEIDDAKEELNKLEPPEWFIFTRDGNPGYSGFWSNASRIEAVATAIPIFFFLVSVLVCLTTMTRMVEEQRTQIGTLKALGFGKGAIAFKYISYAAIASTTGAIAGVIFGTMLFPTVIWNAYRIMYLMPSMHFLSNTGLVLLSIITSVLCTTLATVWACANELRSVPAQLMRPKAPRAGTRVLLEYIPFIWQRMRFSQKVAARNLFRYKKRFFMTVVGVAGCTALLLTGFGVRDSISGIAPLQFGEIFKYEMAASLQDPSSSAENTALNEVLPGLGQSLYMHSAQIDVAVGERTNSGMTTFLYVPEQADRLPTFIDFHTREGKHPIAFPQGDKVVVTEKLAKELEVEPGDTMEINLPDKAPVTVTVAGVMENYVQHYVYMPAETYQKLFNQTPEYNTVLLVPGSDVSANEALTRLVETEGVAGAVNLTSMRDEVNDMLGSLTAVVWAIIIAAGTLAFVVLYNLTNINITERAREIATLKVLGFFNREVANYVYRENILLTLIGAAAGLVLGVFLHRYVMATVEVDEMMFQRAVAPLSYLLATLFTLLCSAAVNLVMLPRLNKINMVESLKSAE